MDMAAPIILFLLLSLYLIGCYSVDGKSETYVTIRLSSLLPSPVCNPSSHASGRKSSSLEVVHKRGPCFINGDHNSSSASSHSEILLQDQARVDSIQSKLSKNSGRVKIDKASKLPAKDGSVVGSGNYIVTVGLGSPKKQLSLVFDTGSDLTWTQCQPCVGSCYHQKEPIFDPRASHSYGNVSCSSSLCSSLSSATGNAGSCESSTCVYGIQYGDSSSSVGFFAKETLTLSHSDVFPGFLFGCGEKNQGLFGGAAGLLGLGRDPVSIVSQTAKKYKKLFSYCLPSTPSSTGHLTFGQGGGGVAKSVQFTPLSTISEGSSFYGLEITGISVGGQKLPIKRSVFTTAGAIIDSGTVITRLPPDAYSSLRSAFRQKMSKYPKAPALSILDTCYDFSKYKEVYLPKIAFSFGGRVVVDLDKMGIMFVNSVSQVCLAFAGNRDANSVAIFGNSQQKTLEVVYDAAKGRVGFAPNGCT